jgi:hypothetical protein
VQGKKSKALKTLNIGTTESCFRLNKLLFIQPQLNQGQYPGLHYRNFFHPREFGLIFSNGCLKNNTNSELLNFLTDKQSYYEPYNPSRKTAMRLPGS